MALPLDALLDGGTGWLLPGRHDVEWEDIGRSFVDASSDRHRGEIWGGLQLLLDAAKELLPSGFLMISGTFVSTQPGPCDRPTVAVVPHDSSALTVWSDAEEERFSGYLSLHDVIIGSLGPSYMPILHPLSGLLEVLYCDLSDAEQLAQWMGSVTLSDGTDKVGERGVLEVEW